MRKIFTPLLLIPCSIVFFACVKQHLNPVAQIIVTPLDSADANAYFDPGNVNFTILNDTFQSFKLIHAYDSGGFVLITAKGVVKGDTCAFSLGFADTLHTNTPYINYFAMTTDSLGFPVNTGAYNFNMVYEDTYVASFYLTGVNHDFTGDTLVITNFDRSKHLLAGTFKATMTASSQESPNITQTSTYVIGTFNTYYNTGK